jgi:hypothetical protein
MKKHPVLRLQQMVNGKPSDKVFFCERSLLEGVLKQHAHTLTASENLHKNFMKLLSEHEQLKLLYKKTIYGPVILNCLMKMGGGGFA